MPESNRHSIDWVVIGDRDHAYALVDQEHDGFEGQGFARMIGRAPAGDKLWRYNPDEEVTVRHFAFRPALTFRGRKFKGLRGFSGKPLHPPLTDVPIGAYLIAAAFDVISFIGNHTSWQREFYQAATFTFIAGALVSLGAVVTGFWDRWRSSEAGTQARRTINAHALLMMTMTACVLVDLGLRWFRYHAEAGPTSALLGLSLAAAVIGAVGATYGGTLVFGYGFNVETSGDHPVWHRSEVDVFPGQPHDVPAASIEPDTGGDSKDPVA